MHSESKMLLHITRLHGASIELMLCIVFTTHAKLLAYKFCN